MSNWRFVINYYSRAGTDGLNRLRLARRGTECGDQALRCARDCGRNRGVS